MRRCTDCFGIGIACIGYQWENRKGSLAFRKLLFLNIAMEA
jgi:hypothetical protein